MLIRSGRRAVWLLGFALAACGGAEPETLVPRAGEEIRLPTVGRPETLDLGTWNLEWFGDPGNGPDDEGIQLANIGRVLAASEVDIWAVQEIVGEAHFQNLVDRLPGFSGLLANDRRVDGGAAHYNDFGGNEQKVGLIFRDAAVELISARVVLTENDHEFAGRPPLEVRLGVKLGATAQEVVVLALHAKAGAREADYLRRRAGAHALKDHLDAVHPSTAVAVLGDFNDDMDVSIFGGNPPPYLPLLTDTASYQVPTLAISESGVASTVNYPDVVDHHLVTDELWARYIPGSSAVLPLGSAIERYGETTSDHYPVVSRYRF